MDKRIGGQKMADDKLRKMDGKGSAAKVAATNEVLDTPKAMQSYKDKAKYSKDRATNSAVATIMRKGDHTDDLKTRAKRVKGLGMADRNATKKTFKALRKEETVNEISKKTAQSYLDKTKNDDAWSGTRKANNRLKGAIHAVGKLRKNEDIQRTADVKMIKYKDPDTGQVRMRRQKKEVQVESYLSEGIIDSLNNIVKRKQASSIKLKDGSKIMVDMQTANLMTRVHNALNDANKKKFADAIGKNETTFMKMLDFAWKQSRR
jgi:hypothetical protein